MTERSIEEEWKNIVETTFKITETMFGRGKTYDLSIAKALNIAGRYQDWLDNDRNKRRDLYDKVEELLNTWKDVQDDVSNIRERLIATLQNNQNFESCQVLITELKHEGNVCGTPRATVIMNTSSLDKRWVQSYVQSDNKTLQCLSYAISECCKELHFYVPPKVVQDNFTTIFSPQKSVLDSVLDPSEFNGKIINIETFEHIETFNNNNIDPMIEIRIEKANSVVYDEVYIYRANTICTNGPCYFVVCKAGSLERQEECFVCYDTSFAVGPKRLRQPLQYLNDSLFTLYKVKVINPLQIRDVQCIEDEMMEIE